MNASVKACISFVLFVVLVGSGGIENATAQETAHHSGTGTAILGSNMTLQEARQFALDVAKRNALEKFGTHVQSTTQWHTEEVDGEMTSDAFERRVEVFAASVVQLVEGTKEVVHNPTGETLKITVTAQFAIDVDAFNERLAQYLSADKTEGVDELVAEYVELDRQGTAADDPDARYALYQERQNIEDTLHDAFQRLDGIGLLETFAESRTQRTQLIERHVSLVTSDAHPSTLFDTDIDVTDIYEQRDHICLQLDVYAEPNANMDRFAETATTLAGQWYSSQESWPPYAFVERMNQSYVLYIAALDRRDRIVFASESGQVTIRYTGLLDNGQAIYEAPTPDRSQQFCVSQDIFADVEEIGLVFTRFEVPRRLASYMSQRHYRGTAAGPEHAPIVYAVERARNRIDIENVLLTPDAFQQEINTALEYLESVDDESTERTRVGF